MDADLLLYTDAKVAAYSKDLMSVAGAMAMRASSVNFGTLDSSTWCYHTMRP